MVGKWINVQTYVMTEAIKLTSKVGGGGGILKKGKWKKRNQKKGLSPDQSFQGYN